MIINCAVNHVVAPAVCPTCQTCPTCGRNGNTITPAVWEWQPTMYPAQWWPNAPYLITTTSTHAQ